MQGKEVCDQEQPEVERKELNGAMHQWHSSHLAGRSTQGEEFQKRLVRN